MRGVTAHKLLSIRPALEIVYSPQNVNRMCLRAIHHVRSTYADKTEDNDHVDYSFNWRKTTSYWHIL